MLHNCSNGGLASDDGGCPHFWDGFWSSVGVAGQIEIDKLSLGNVVAEAVNLDLVHDLAGKGRGDALPVVLDDVGRHNVFDLELDRFVDDLLCELGTFKRRVGLDDLLGDLSEGDEVTK